MMILNQQWQRLIIWQEQSGVIIAFGSLAFLGDLTEIIKKHNGGNND